MKIVVAIKQVHERDARIRIDSSGKWIDFQDVELAMNESVGPERVGHTVRKAIAIAAGARIAELDSAQAAGSEQ
jgi:hypothetical protein